MSEQASREEASLGMRALDIIQAKRQGHEIGEEGLRWLIAAYTAGDVPDYQMAAFLMAVVWRGMSDVELAAWTDAMLRSGQVLSMPEITAPKVDKHSTGGVGDKVSLILAPLAVAAGLKVPMIAGRGLGHTGGTVDKLHAIPGFRMDLDVERFKQHVADYGCCLMAQTEHIAPADRKLYALRDVTATVECIPLIASSIMSKKLAEGLDALVLDVKVGNGAFMRDVEQARELSRTMIRIGASMGCRVHALLTDMNQPLGQAVGNSLEVIESIETLRGQGPEDLTELTLELTLEMLRAAGMVEDDAASMQQLRTYLEDGTALRIFRELVEAQGGDGRVCDDPVGVMGSARATMQVRAASAGVVASINTEEVGHAAAELGGGRRTKEDEIDPTVGFIFHKRLGERVEAGEALVTVHYNDEARLKLSLARLEPAIVVAERSGPGVPGPLILDRLS
jgi:pyrimidine-nucleoside phosphorylase